MNMKNKSIEDANEQAVVKKLTLDELMDEGRRIIANLEDVDQLPEYTDEEYETSIIAIQNKVLGSAYAVHSMIDDIDMLKRMEKEIIQRRKNVERKKEWLRDKCVWAFREFGLEPINSYLRVNIGKNPDKLGDELEIDKIPDSYKDVSVKIRVSAMRGDLLEDLMKLLEQYNVNPDIDIIPDKKVILKHLRDGDIIPGAELVKGGFRLNIKKPRG